MGKHTHYFATYADAYNYYPNGIPSTEIAIVGDASYVFVSSDNSYSGNTTFFDANMTNDEIVDTMSETAYNAGTTYGYEVGFDEGYDDGYDEGFADGVESVPTPEGNIDITTTSQYDVTTYATAQVADANLTASNIVSGVTILGVSGSYTGLVPSGNINITTTSQVDVTNYATAQVVDANLTAGNIADGVTILGVSGSYTGLVPSGTMYIENTMPYDVTTYSTAQVVDMNLTASNIKNGVTILGVVGEYTGSGINPSGTYYIENTGLANVANYEYAIINDAALSPENISEKATILGVQGTYTGLQPSGTYYLQNAASTANVREYEYAAISDMNLTASNIKNGVTILGVTGSYVDTASYTNGYNAGYAAGTTYGYDWGQSAGGGASLSPDSNLVSYASKQQVFEKSSLYLMPYDSSGPSQSPSDVYYGFYPFFGDWPYYIDTFVPSTNSILPVNIEDVQYYPIGYDENNPDIESIMILIDNVSNGDVIGFSEFSGTESPDPMDPENMVYNVESINWLIHSIGNGNYSHWYTMSGLSSSNTGVIFKFDYYNPTGEYAISYREGSTLPTPPAIEPDEPTSHYEACPACGGSGFFPAAIEGEEPTMCPTCEGTGQILVEDTPAAVCATCGGTGIIPDPVTGADIPCMDCGGTGTMP